MNYWKALSLILVLSTGMAYGMDENKKGFIDYIKRNDPAAKNFGQAEWNEIINEIYQPLVEGSKASGQPLSDMILEIVEDNSLLRHYFKYRTLTMLKKLEPKLSKLDSLLKEQAESKRKFGERVKGERGYEEYERESREYQDLLKRFKEEYGRDPILDEELKLYERYLLEEEEKAFKEEYKGIAERIEKREIARDKELKLIEEEQEKKAKRLLEEKERQERALEEAKNNKVVYAKRQAELEETEKKYHKATKKLELVKAEKAALRKTKNELESEIENQLELRKAAIQQLQERTNELDELKKQLEEAKRSKNEPKKEELQDEIQNKQEEVNQEALVVGAAEAKIEGDQNALALKFGEKEAKGFGEKEPADLIEKLQLRFDAVKKMIDVIVNLVESGYSDEIWKQYTELNMSPDKLNTEINALIETIRAVYTSVRSEKLKQNVDLINRIYNYFNDNWDSLNKKVEYSAENSENRAKRIKADYSQLFIDMQPRKSLTSQTLGAWLATLKLKSVQ